MTEESAAILFATPGEQHADVFLLSCLLAGMVSPKEVSASDPQDVILVSGGGPDGTVETLLQAARCRTLADVFERLAPGRFCVQEIETTWNDSPFWMIDDDPVGRIVMLGHDDASLASLVAFATQRAAPVAISQIHGSRLQFLFGRRDADAPGELQRDANGHASVVHPHVGMAAVTAGMLACWLRDLDVQTGQEENRHVCLDLARPWIESVWPSNHLHTLSEPVGSTRLALVSAGGLMSNVALLVAAASSEVMATIIDDDAFTPDQWRYWVIRLMSDLAGLKVDRTAAVVSGISLGARVDPHPQRIDRDNVGAILPWGLFDAVITTPDNDVCRSAVADLLSPRIAEETSPTAHALGGARDFGAEVYVETADTAAADTVLMLSDRAEAERTDGGIEPTGCADPRAELGVIVANIVCAGLLVVELSRVLNGDLGTGCLYRYSLGGNSIRAYGPFVRQAQRRMAGVQL